VFCTYQEIPDQVSLSKTPRYRFQYQSGKFTSVQTTHLEADKRAQTKGAGRNEQAEPLPQDNDRGEVENRQRRSSVLEEERPERS